MTVCLSNCLSVCLSNTYIDSDHLWGSKFLISILFFFGGGEGGQEKEYFFRYDKIGLVLGVVFRHFRVFS